MGLKRIADSGWRIGRGGMRLRVSLSDPSAIRYPLSTSIWNSFMSAPALLIVDMQVGMSWPKSGVRNNPGAEEAIATLLQDWRTRRAPIVHIRHMSRTPGSPFWPGQPGAEFQPALAPLDSEHVVEKNVPDAL